MPAEHERVERAEREIQKILLRLAEEVGHPIDHVDVDCRNFADLRTEIFFR